MIGDHVCLSLRSGVASHSSVFTRSLIVAGAVGLVASLWLGLGDARMRVIGFSMAPGLRQGDLVRWTSQVLEPRRYDRVICQRPGGQPVLKRVVGLGGENLQCQNGELFVDGVWQRKNLRQLAVFGIPVISQASGLASGRTGWFGEAGQWAWSSTGNSRRDWLVVDLAALPHELGGDCVPLLYDDSPWLSVESRRLQPVADAGLAAVVDVDTGGGHPVEITIRVGEQAACIVVRGSGAFACVSGRLDGRLVAAAWPVGGTQEADDRLEAWLEGAVRSALPPDGPDEWAVVKNLPLSGPFFPLGISARVLPNKQMGTRDAAPQLTISRLVFWRDVHWLPHPNGQDNWTIPAGQLFLLGDCPAASRDSRHWGPLAVEAVLGVVTETLPLQQER